jgi:hypothetical protein
VKRIYIVLVLVALVILVAIFKPYVWAAISPVAMKFAKTKMIHGSAVSVGCLAMGDEAAEDLFVLAADAGLKSIIVILTPVDFREDKTVPKSAGLPGWTESLYQTIQTRLKELPKAHPP